MSAQNNLTYQKSNVVISSFMSITIHGYRLMSYINYKTQEIEKAGKINGFQDLEFKKLLQFPSEVAPDLVVKLPPI